MATFQCIDCELHYCTDCDGGEDQCGMCSTGPRCDECAFDHHCYHKEQDPEDDVDDETDLTEEEIAWEKGTRKFEEEYQEGKTDDKKR